MRIIVQPLNYLERLVLGAAAELNESSENTGQRHCFTVGRTHCLSLRCSAAPGGCGAPGVARGGNGQEDRGQDGAGRASDGSERGGQYAAALCLVCLSLWRRQSLCLVCLPLWRRQSLCLVCLRSDAAAPCLVCFCCLCGEDTAFAVCVCGCLCGQAPPLPCVFPLPLPCVCVCGFAAVRHRLCLVVPLPLWRRRWHLPCLLQPLSALWFHYHRG